MAPDSKSQTKAAGALSAQAGDGRKTTQSRRPEAPKVDDNSLRRVVIEAVTPEVDQGRFRAKATLGEDVIVEADIFAHGTDVISAAILHRPSEDTDWSEAPMKPLENDRWRGTFPVNHLGTYLFTIEGWTDPFLTWRRDLEKRLAAGQKVPVEFEIGGGLVRDAAARASGKDRTALLSAAERLLSGGTQALLARAALAPRLGKLMAAAADRAHATRFGREVQVRVDPEKARFSSWYEMFPRSLWSVPTDGKRATARRASRGHATFRDVEARLPYVAKMDFDVLYLPPVHPIGRTHRKGPNNAAVAKPGDPGSPWAIGSEDGGHKTVNPALGTLADFRRLVRNARDKYGIDVALDIAYQCSPDHPYVREHPQWFRHRPDGTVQYAENPPKKYEDIYPFDFQTKDWRALWDELKSIVDFWIEQGVRVFRVDNPHTKPFAFWEWMLGEVYGQHPEVIFLAEAFTRPKIMHRLAKLGFHQSYTYFAWRNQKWDLAEYVSELTTSPVQDFFRPIFWPNTPDILNDVLQHGGRPAFIARLVLAATMSSSYGIYGPAFELMQHEPREQGSEEYLHSEKYEVRTWDIASAGSLHEVIAIVNGARRDHPALQTNRNFRFHNTDNPQIIAFSRRTDDSADVLLIVVNLDYRYTQSGWLDIATEEWGIAPAESYVVHDLLTDARYTWRGGHNFIKLDPDVMPAHIFVVSRPRARNKVVA